MGNLCIRIDPEAKIEKQKNTRKVRNIACSGLIG